MASVLGLSSAGASVIGERSARRLLSSLARRYFCYVIARRARGDRRQSFEYTWRHLSNFSPFLWCLKRGWFSSRHSSVLTEIMGLYCQYAPELYGSVRTVVHGNLFDALSGDKSVILVDFHQSHVGVTKTLCEYGITHNRIVANVSVATSLFLSIGLDISKVHLIERSVCSLATMREAVRRGDKLCCAVDFRRNGQYVLLSPTMFEFARRVRVPVMFVKTVIDMDGNIHLHNSSLMEVSNAEESAASMLEFFNSIQGDNKSAEIQRFSVR